MRSLTLLGLLAGLLLGILGCNAGGTIGDTVDVVSDSIIVVGQDVQVDEEQIVQIKNVGIANSVVSITVQRWEFVILKPIATDPSRPSMAAADLVAVIPFDRVPNGVSSARIPETLTGNFFIRARLTYKYNKDIAKETPEKPALDKFSYDAKFAPFSRTDCGPRPGYTGSQTVIDLGTRQAGVATDLLLESFVESGVKPFQYQLPDLPSDKRGDYPPGLSLVDGSLIGTPTVGGTFEFIRTVIDACGVGRAADLKFRLRIESDDECDAPPVIGAPSATTGSAGTPFEAIGTLSGTGTITLALTLQGGAPAPAWLQVALTDARSWRLFGTPPAAQDLTITLRATDNCDPPQSSTRDISLSISACEGTPPSLQNFNLPIAAINQPWEATLGVSGGTGAIALEPVTAPLWISINGTTVSGIPPEAGSFPMSFRARDACGRVSATVAGSLRVIDTSPGVWNAYSPFPDISGSDYAVIAYQNRPVVLIDGTSNVLGEGGQPLVEVYFGLNEDPQAIEDWQKLRLETLNPPSTSVTPALTIHDGRLAAVYRANDTGTPYLRLRQATKLNPVAEGDWLATSVPLAAPESEMLMEHSRLSLASVGGRLVTAARNQVYISNSGTPVDPPASNWTKHGVTGESGFILFRYKNPQLAVGDERLWMLVTASQTPMEHLLLRASKVLPSTDADWSQQTFDAGIGTQMFADFRPSLLVRSNGRPALSYYTRVAGSTARTRQQRLLLATTAEPTSPSDWDELLLDPIGGGSSSLMQVNGTLMLAYGFRFNDYLAQNPEQEPRFWRIATSRTTPDIHPNQLSDWWPVQALFENNEEDPTATQMRLRGRLLLYSGASRVGMIGSSESNVGGAVIPASAKPPS